MMDVAVKESLGGVAVTQEPATLNLASAVQDGQKEDTVTQEPVSLEVMDVAVEKNLGKFVVTQEPATLIVNLDVQDDQKEDTVPQEPVPPPLRNFIDWDSDQEEHHKKEILDLTAEISILRMEMIKWKSQVEEY